MVAWLSKIRLSKLTITLHTNNTVSISQQQQHQTQNEPFNHGVSANLLAMKLVQPKIQMIYYDTITGGVLVLYRAVYLGRYGNQNYIIG